jgi:uncharacterized membrane protein YecN with MAPEG domain
MSTTTVLTEIRTAWLLPVTLTTAAVCAGLQVALTALVISRRARCGVSFLDGGDTVLTRRMRAHGNFTETVPLTLLLIALLEMAMAPRGLLSGLAGLLIVGRLLHAAGVLSRGDSWARRLGMVATLWSLSALGAASLWYGLRGW